MSREENKLPGAMRLFEALSGVDEELLAKADDTKVKTTKFSGKKVRLAATLAAAASLFLVVEAVWTDVPMFDSKNAAETAVMTKGEMMTFTADSTADDTEEVAEEVRTEAAEEEASCDESAGSSEKARQESAYEKEVTGEKNGSVETSEGLHLDNRVKLSESQAREAEILGERIPEVLPAGYIWESARAKVNDKNGTYESLSLCWTKGMDSIMITISLADNDSVILTDVAKPETYDVRFYEIPYAETVPEEYREVFENPVFAAEDLSLELVQSRMKSVADKGDTDTPRGNFSVIYPDGILLYFNGDGTAEEIWKMLR